MKPRAHHTVPRFYLQGFIDPRLEALGQEMLWVYEPGKEPRKSAPRKVAKEKDFYLLEGDEKRKRVDIEDMLQRLEDVSAPQLRKLSAGDLSLSPQERGEFAGFVALMFTRVPFYHDAADRMAAEKYRQFAKATAVIPNALEEAFIKLYEKETGETLDMNPQEVHDFLLSDQYTFEQTSRAWTIRKMFEGMLRIMPILERMKWTLLESTGGVSFLTSDNPVALYDPSPPSPYAFAASPHSEVTFPISRKFCLLFRWRGPAGLAVMRPAGVQVVNKRTIQRAYRQVYASQCSTILAQLLDKIWQKKPQPLSLRTRRHRRSQGH